MLIYTVFYPHSHLPSLPSTPTPPPLNPHITPAITVSCLIKSATSSPPTHTAGSFLPRLPMMLPQPPKRLRVPPGPPSGGECPRGAVTISIGNKSHLRSALPTLTSGRRPPQKIKQNINKYRQYRLFSKLDIDLKKIAIHFLTNYLTLESIASIALL